MTRNSIIIIAATAAVITSAITPTMAGIASGRPGPKSGGGFSAPSNIVECPACLSRNSRYFTQVPNPTFPISGPTGGSAPGAGHIKCARMPC
jgi:hypothetical protein